MLQIETRGSTGLDVLLRALEPQFRRIARRYRIDAVDAEDLVQETSLRYLRIQHSVADPRSWLPFVFRRECLRFLRKSNKSRALVVDLERFEELFDPPLDDFRAECLDLVEALRGLRPRHRLLLWWRYGLGMSEAEVAATLGCERASAKKASSRALGAIRQAMCQLPSRGGSRARSAVDGTRALRA